MTIEEKKLKKLEELLRLSNDGLTREEFVTAFQEVVKFVEKLSKTNEAEFTELRKAFDVLSAKVKEDTGTDMADVRAECKKMMDKMMKDNSSTMNFMRDKMKTHYKGLDGYTPVKGVDYFDGLPGTPGINGSPDTPTEVRDKLESLEGDERLDRSAIKGLDEELKRLETVRGRSGGGTSAMGVVQTFKYIAHTEAPVGAIDGNNTTYTVKATIWWIAGFTLNGEQIAELPNFTYANKTITFATALPAVYSGKDFEIKYIGY